MVATDDRDEVAATSSTTAASALAGVTCAALAIPAAAQAATKVVSMGAPAALKALQQRYGSEANDFFPHVTTIDVGDSVRFRLSGFHTVDLPKKGGDPLPFATTGPPQSGIVDAAGAPFWFNGQPQIQFNPALLPKPSSARSRATAEASASPPASRWRRDGSRR